MRVLRECISILGAVLALASLHACKIGPDYERPDIETPAKFDRELPQGMSASVPATERWWQDFQDPLLEQFIGRAELQNMDLKQAVAALEEYRAQYDISFAKLFPDIEADGSYSRVKVNNNSVGAAGAAPAPFNRWTYGMTMASWEIDLWGKIRRQIEATQGRYAATAEDYRSALVSVRADVAQGYITVRVLQAQRAFAAEMAEALHKVVAITEAQVRYQTANKIDLAEARARYSASLAQVAQLDGSLADQINGLSLLLGEMPGEVRRQMSEPRSIPRPHGEVAVGIPAALILRRPDIRAAEHMLAAATADIGVAQAAYLPELSLTGTIGVDASSFSGLGNVSGNLTYLFGPSIRWDFFKIIKGQTEAEVNIARARVNSALTQYQRSILQAMKEIDSAIANYSTSRGVRDNFAEANREVTGAYDLAMRKYQSGTIDLTQLIQFLEILIRSREGLAQGEGLVAQNLVEVYRSLGGGWETTPLPPAADSVAPLVEPPSTITQAQP